MLIVLVQNDGTGEHGIAHYDYEVRINNQTLARGRVTNYERSRGWVALLRRVADAAECCGRERE